MQTARRMLLNDETQRLARPRDDALRFRRDSEVALGPVLLQIVGHRALRANDVPVMALVNAIVEALLQDGASKIHQPTRH